ncbi:MAG: NADPH-dependent F420 reductase [Gemmatimonadaceae bacterium]
MRIAIIGAGNVGGALGRRWAELGHDVTFGVRRPAEGASAIKGGAKLPAKATVASIADAVKSVDAIALATPWVAVRGVLAEIGGAPRGVPLLDATNPLGAGFALDVGPNGESAAERIQALAPAFRVVKIFNTTGYNNMLDPNYGGSPATMFYAGDDVAAKGVARTLATELGFEPVDAGALVRARELEHLALLWISLAFGGMGREIAFRLVKR